MIKDTPEGYEGRELLREALEEVREHSRVALELTHVFVTRFNV
jgi:hypothetical protein